MYDRTLLICVFLTGKRFQNPELVMKFTDIIDQAKDPAKDMMPTSIKLVKQLKVGLNPTAVLNYKGYTYVGHNDGTIEKIDDENDKGSLIAFIKLQSTITGLAGSQDQLYILTHTTTDICHSVHVFDLRGHHLNSWRHETYTDFFPSRSLALVNSHVVIADRQKQTFTFYNQAGDQRREVPCNLIKLKNLAICDAGDNSILVANCDSNPCLYKVDLTTGAVVWSLDHEYRRAVGVCRLNEMYSIFTIRDSVRHTCIRLLNHQTGTDCPKQTEIS